jgi:ABC-type uncharacterized transport system permease subunit
VLRGISTNHKVFLGLIVVAVAQAAYHFPRLPNDLPAKHFRETGEVFPKWQLIVLATFCFALVVGLYLFVERLIDGKLKEAASSAETAALDGRAAPPLKSFGLLFAGLFVGLLGVFEGSYRSYEQPNGYGSWILLVSLVATFVFGNAWALIMASRVQRSQT